MNYIQPTSFHVPVHKSIDDPWIGLLVLCIVIFVSSIISIIILCLQWRRYQQSKQINNENYILSNKSTTGKRQIPVQIEDQQPKPYETQRMEVFVPPNGEERIHARFPPHDGIPQVHKFYERSTKAYF